LLDEKNTLQNIIRDFEGEPSGEYLAINQVSDAVAARGLLQSQIENTKQLLTTRMNNRIEAELTPLLTRIEELESDFDSTLTNQVI
tara:strand:- start:1797 stop:2054 length:258 start_codon:yes stop_codon:yes gene_type:complete